MTTKTSSFRPELTAEVFNRRSAGHLPGLAGVEMLVVSAGEVQSRMAVRREVMAPNGFLHAASVIALADTSCGYGCLAHLPQEASGFTTVELKANFVGTARDGAIRCRAWPVHLGRTTQVWDAEVAVEGTEMRIALFRCTQMVLWPK
jgi:1,4-dihydroxy-2-naphthoyl-CoA hydrolase